MPTDPRPHIEAAIQNRSRETTRELGRRIVDEAMEMQAALTKIATGDGYYGTQAREYKNIARAVLRLPLI